MQRFFLSFICLCSFSLPLQALTVRNVTVSMRAKSLEEAREEAIERAHQLAFQKMRDDYFPDSISKTTPPPEKLKEMVENFSIEKEKNGTDNKTYTASLSFEFNQEAAHKWFEHTKSPKTASMVARGTPLKVKVSYTSLPQWQRIKHILQMFPEGHEMRLLSLTTHDAEIELPYARETTILQEKLKNEGLRLQPEQGYWTLE